MTNWNLIKEMETLHREMDRIFRGAGFGPAFESAFLPGIGTRRYPRVNLREEQDGYRVEALLPGVDAKAIEMSIAGNTLTLSGERRELEASAGQTWHRRERGAGKFMRTIELPGEIDAARVSAEYRNGVLTVTLPKAEAAKPRMIPVKVN